MCGFAIAAGCTAFASYVVTSSAAASAFYVYCFAHAASERRCALVYAWHVLITLISCGLAWGRRNEDDVIASDDYDS